MVVTSSGEHEHTILVTPSEIFAGTEITVLSSNSQNHAHFVRITPADFVALRAGMEVRKKACDGADHEWVLSCWAVRVSSPGTPTCSDDCGDGTEPANACP
jgi:hypothetical protein